LARCSEPEVIDFVGWATTLAPLVSNAIDELEARTDDLGKRLDYARWLQAADGLQGPQASPLAAASAAGPINPLRRSDPGDAAKGLQHVSAAELRNEAGDDSRSDKEIVVARPCCSPNRAACLTGAERDDIANHVAIDGAGLITTTGRLAGRAIRGAAFMHEGRRYASLRVKRFLADGRWPARPNRRSGRGALTKAERKAADGRLLDALRSHPAAKVSEIAALVDVGRTNVSQRLGRLKALGWVDSIDGRWVVELPAALPQPPDGRGRWVRPLFAAHDRDVAARRAGNGDDRPKDYSAIRFG
jgi:hypothetical protein